MVRHLCVRYSCRRRISGQDHYCLCSVTGRTQHSQLAAHFLDAFAHSAKTDAVMPFTNSESVTVITEFQTKFLRAGSKLRPELLGVSILQSIAQGFLANA